VLAIAPPLPEDEGGPGMLTADQVAAKASGMRRGEVPNAHHRAGVPLRASDADVCGLYSSWRSR